ncbi:TPA: hypothetical protein GND40_004025 [Salmonella enterica subsp. indica]|uniref:Uncharacterized protein n=2 Tax=Salmonella enterica TaxID=28901 RepID=A0A753E5B0_SALER|nr:hypothetical protein [Salmonella enterica subsp. indica serovar 45:a:e,n,x]HAE8104618.1 hypothetical protein [Salmonella enterica subsp. indica serovar 45:a:e,n,x]HAF7948015.1 hypothetical protein [Salmonella enterica subsp. indica]
MAKKSIVGGDKRRNAFITPVDVNENRESVQNLLLNGRGVGQARRARQLTPKIITVKTVSGVEAP